jgi:hypothetical protein
MSKHHKQSLASREVFVRRLALNGLLGLLLLVFSLVIGMFGYHFLGKLSWVDSLLNASMILGGMGPVDRMEITEAKIFASVYAIYSGVILLASVSILMAPIFHRFLHHFRLADEDQGDSVS